MFSEEAVEENRKINGLRTSVISASGKPQYAMGTDIVVRAFYAMTKAPHPDRKQRSTREG